MTDSSRWNTYHRSTFKRLVGLKTTEYSFKTEAGMKADKTGTYYNPFHFQGYRNAVKRKENDNLLIINENRYDDFLTYQHQLADHLAKEITRLSPAPNIKANADNDYNCVLIHFPKPDRQIKDADWANFCIIYFVAISNHLSEIRGLNTEIVRRSGFGHLRPSIAETSPSIRINVGCIPKIYAQVLIDTSIMVHHLLCKNSAFFKQAIQLDKLSEDFKTYNHENRNKKVNSNLSVNPTLWDNFWANMDSMNHSFIYQIMRKESNVEHIINLFMNGLRELEIDLNDVFRDEQQIKTLFVNPWIQIFENYHLNNDKRMVLELDTDTIQTCYQWKNAPVLVEDEAFWAIISKYIEAFDARAGEQIKNNTLEDLHTNLEKLSENFFFHHPGIESSDGYGSDSDCEAEYETPQKNKEKIYAKKFITATGMRSIQMAFASVKLYMNEITRLNFRNLQSQSDRMYYETPMALKKHSITVPLEDVRDLAEKATITLFDLNHCNTTHKPQKKIGALIKDTFPILILDTTSSTMRKTGTSIKELFNAHPHLSTIISVSSGLKNEQAGSDFNPYGTIRLFSKTAAERDAIYRILTKLEDKWGYKHPAVSHLFRKNAKKSGMVPENAKILSTIATP